LGPDKLKAAGNWITGDFASFLNKKSLKINQSGIRPESLCSLIEMIEGGSISSKIAKSVFEEMAKSKKEPAEIIKAKNLEQVSDEGELAKIIDDVISANAEVVQQVKSGKDKAIGFLIGQVMAKTKGKANPALVNGIMLKKLKS